MDNNSTNINTNTNKNIMLETFNQLSEIDQKNLLSLHCRYHNTVRCEYNKEKNATNKYLPTIIFTVNYSKTKDNYEKEMCTDLCQKSTPFENNICIQYQHIIGILMHNKEFNTDILDNILIIHNNYAVHLKNIDENNTSQGTSLHVDINKIIIDSNKFKNKRTDLNTLGIIAGITLTCIVGIVFCSYFEIKPVPSTLTKELIELRRRKMKL
jgi:hypothetical protein